MAERGSRLGVAAEPYRVPLNHPCWAVDRCGSVAITWRATEEPVACTRLVADDGFVAVRWGHIVVVGVYFSFNKDVAQFEGFLDRLRDFVERILPQPVIVAGDFNAKAALWGSPITNARGRILEDWAAGLGLVCVNTGNAQTCARH
ncbi:uncharacterized protein [Temnothorax longispinosus]|uniref:uncharacterized protein n=1 Tax=Temnothorax longispinosus TaxID=300112 RepID=UPI003A9A50A0